MVVKASGDYSDRFNEFAASIKSNEKEIYAILTQLDPDAIGSAALFRTLCKHFNRKVKIRYAGGIDHPQNECIFNVFELDKSYKQIDGIPTGAEVALLDSAIANDSRLRGMTISPLYIIDHHMTYPEPIENSWYFIESFGSCCSILALMLKHFAVEFEEGDDSPTLGAIGIYGDTNQFCSAHTTDPDVDAFNFLMKYGSWEQFRRVHDFKFPADYYRILEVVLRNSKTHNTFLVSCAGYLKEDQGVYLAIIAEDLIKQEGISTVITWGVIGDSVIVKARSTNNNLRLDKWMKEKFGENCAGAKSGAGGANVRLGFFSPRAKNKESLLKCLEDTIMENLVETKADEGHGAKVS